jgi:hypothetical protein
MLNDIGMAKGFIQTKAPLGHWKKHIEENPIDLRRPYIGAGIAARLLSATTLGRPSQSRGYRYRNAQPWTGASPAHGVLVASLPREARSTKHEAG